MGQGILTSQAQSPAAAPVKLIPRSHAERERRYRDLHHIVLNVLALDASYNAATGLKAEDFSLMDNGQPQVLSSFRAVMGDRSIAPPHIVLILDALNNTTRSIAYEVKEIGKYLELNQGRLPYPTSIAVLTTSGLKASGASTDGSELLQKSRTLFKGIRPYECKSASENGTQAQPLTGHGGWNIGMSVEKVDDGNCLNERFAQSLTALGNLTAAQKNAPGRVMLIWIGPGWPLLTGAEFHRDTPETKAIFFDHVVEMSRTLREAQVTIDAVYSPDMFRRGEMQSVLAKSLTEGPRTEQQATASDLALEAIATQSGGRVLESKNIADQIEKFVEDEQTYYALSFDSPSASKPVEYHSLQVKVNKPGVKVFTSTLYYAEP